MLLASNRRQYFYLFLCQLESNKTSLLRSWYRMAFWKTPWTSKSMSYCSRRCRYLQSYIIYIYLQVIYYRCSRMSKAIASLLEQLPSAQISALDFCELCGSMYSHNLFYMSNWKVNIKTLKHFNRSVLKLLTSKTTILMQTILTFSPIPSRNWTENISQIEQKIFHTLELCQITTEVMAGKPHRVLQKN